MKFAFLALLFASALSHGAVVLQYHHVDTSTPPITSTDPALYREHLEYIESSDLEVVALTEIVNKPGRVDDKRIAITFDDAYDNLLENAIPELTKRGWPFTIFVATEYIGRNGYLSWQDLRDIEAAGGSIANHTHSHLHMIRMLEGETRQAWLDRLKAEIQKAQDLLEQNLEGPVKYIAYPYGEYNLDILNLIDELGYVGFGQQSGAIGLNTDQRYLPRFPLSGIYARVDLFKVKVHTQSLPAEVAYYPPQFEDNPPSMTLRFDSNPSLRLNQLRCYGPGGETHLEQTSEFEYVVTNQQPLPVARSRYNCTMPIAGSRHYYWFSQLWIRKKLDGSWYQE